MSRQNYYARRRRRQVQEVDAETGVGVRAKGAGVAARLGTRKLMRRLKSSLGRAASANGARSALCVIGPRGVAGCRGSRRPIRARPTLSTACGGIPNLVKEQPAALLTKCGLAI